MKENETRTAEENTSRFYQLLKNYNNFDNIEILGVLQSLLSPTAEEGCFIGIYCRAQANVETLLEIKHAKHFQAAAMLTRGVFELAVDIKILEATPNGWIKMTAFNDVERLRCARKIVAYKEAHTDVDLDPSDYQSFIYQHQAGIDARRKACWPDTRGPRHWTGLGLAERVSMLGAPMDRIYEVDYPRLSWYVHSGLTGVVNFNCEAFVHLCANAFSLTADCYREILDVIIRRFKIDNAAKDIDSKLSRAATLPFIEDPRKEA